MGEHFIHDIEFKNFKCFQELKVEGAKRVNLIGGKNNIGKTSFMEGLELFLSSRDAYSLGFNVYNMTRRRQRNSKQERYIELDFIYDEQSKVKLSIDGRSIEVEYSEEYIKKIDTNTKTVEYLPDTPGLFEEENTTIRHEAVFKIDVNGDKRILPLDRIMDSRLPLGLRRDFENKTSNNFITSATTNEREIAIYYGKLIDFNKEQFLDDSLKIFDENLVALKQKVTERDVVLKVSLKDRDTPILLSSLGEGINRYIAILCAIWASKDGYLFIDEIENGIHWTNYEKLWKIIFEASAMAKCQVFATTHSKECIEAFNKMNEKDDGVYLEFYRNQKTGLINVQERGHEQLAYSLTHGGEIRGE